MTTALHKDISALAPIAAASFCCFLPAKDKADCGNGSKKNYISTLSTSL
jgi:hypothetical protein